MLQRVLIFGDGTMSLILVVEQEGRYIERIHDALASEGWQVRVANDRASAERAAAQERPALVVVSSEVGGAREILAGFSRRRGGPGALVLVSEGSEGALSAANYEADDLLAKPFTDSDLRLLVRRTLNAAQRQAAEAHAASTKRFTSKELFSDMLAEVERETAAAAQAPPTPAPRPAADVQKKLEQTLSGLFDKPAAKAAKPASGPGRHDVDSLLSKSLSGLDLHKTKTPSAPAKPAPVPPEPPKLEPARVEPAAPQAAPPPAAPVPAAPVHTAPAPAAPPPAPVQAAPPPKAPVSRPVAPEPAAGDRPSKSFRAPEELLKQVAERAAEKPRTATGELKRKELDFSQLDELVKPAPKSTTKSGASKSGADAFRTQRIETVRPPVPEGPREFGQYTLLERIATGGMAEVWKARMRGVEGFQKIVAIKKILPHLTDNEDFVTMFIDEAKLAAQLNHNNIIHIYDLGKIADDYYIAMEYVEGKDLRSILNHGARAAIGRMPLGLALLVAVAPRLGARLRAPQEGLRGPRARPRPPRRLAAERAHRLRRRHQALRLRHRQGGVEGVEDADGRAQGQAPVHVARAGLGQGGRRALRHLLARRAALRDAHRPAPVRRRQRDVDSRCRARGARSDRPRTSIPRSRARSTSW